MTLKMSGTTNIQSNPWTPSGVDAKPMIIINFKAKYYQSTAIAFNNCSVVTR